ncbi:hypothetical protein YYC_03634 [Plasmodium yoelii 17X]|uniref:Uncharacterized protein n=3 Tax=Plasmodium yoelii TaxID=5861 RepID=A0AAF0B2B8_PLAYO|nr:conserved Plasmodium protein, unknown function [Plasmodium yoelii]ETB58870.1 hypothetical protein YYC_03634 [Plasmodium yoelii 17X]WBY55696.1 hypothetical protein Py17XNL_000504526 [Plasmodium yoelii yoelii]CDU16760.1 conserved Plasmodium protein, unknown function [Plasmodium yoelii]VTZ74346.1 conserved Plasmodium protein, unknown function [Plasmodium yoelii]|eukprot:XP_022811688.1 conserved Plasmodium protein, unknown function [Plasmodium yoelii]
MDDFINNDAELKRKAWNLHFGNKRNIHKYKFQKNTKNKYITKWVKEKDEENLFERWTKITTPNKKYTSESEGEKLKDEQRKNKNAGTKLVPQNNNTRRSYRLNLQSILQEGAYKKNYVDPDSDMFLEEEDSR